MWDVKRNETETAQAARLRFSAIERINLQATENGNGRRRESIDYTTAWKRAKSETRDSP
jgi:hypothetical protein